MPLSVTRAEWSLALTYLHHANPRQNPDPAHVEELRPSVRQGQLRDMIGIKDGDRVGLIDGWHLREAMLAEGYTKGWVTLLDPSTPPARYAIMASFLNCSQQKLSPREQALHRFELMRANDWSETDLERESGGLLKQSATAQLLAGLDMHPEALARWDGKLFGRYLGYYVSRYPYEEQPEIARRICAKELTRDDLIRGLASKNGKNGKPKLKTLKKAVGKVKGTIVYDPSEGSAGIRAYGEYLVKLADKADKMGVKAENMHAIL